MQAVAGIIALIDASEDQEARSASVTRFLEEVPVDNGDRIVILDWDGQPPKFCNLLRLAADGSIVWTATPDHPLEGVWTRIELRAGRLEAYSWSGYLHVIDLKTGRILERTFVK